MLKILISYAKKTIRKVVVKNEFSPANNKHLLFVKLVGN